MPFTFSHPALIIPLLRRPWRRQWVSATGLVVGSVAPDFEKFLRLQLASSHSHTAASIFYFSLPVGLALAFVFHGLVRRPLLAHLPAPLYRRLSQYDAFEWPAYCRRHYGGVGLSIGLGAALHLFWDLFTHRNALTMRVLPELAQAFRAGPWLVTWFELVGAASSAAGGLAIAWAVWQLPVRVRGPVPAPAAVRRYWTLVLLVAAALTTQWALLVRPRLLSVGISAISAAMLGVLLVSLYTSYAARRTARERPSRESHPRAGVGKKPG